MLSNCEVHKVKKVQFGIYSEQDILRSSVCEVNSTGLYHQGTQLPAEHGLNDPRMGITQRGLVCQTCFGDLKECPGHFGHIKLAEIVYHPEFLETTYKVLKSVCYHCSKLLISPEKLSSILQIKSKQKRLNEISKQAARRCGFETDPGCERVQPRYRRRKMDILVRRNEEKHDVNEEDSKRVFRASEVYDIFKGISDETNEILGLSPKFSRPEFMLIKLLIVVPPSVRPSIELSSQARSEDDITHLYQSILSTNQELLQAKLKGQPRTSINEIVFRLQSYVTYLMDNSDGKAKQKGGRPTKSIAQRLKGKEGRLRGNLMGKRVDFSSRTVVSPDPSLELDQLGVPEEIATELTIPERVTQLNYEFLKNLVERGDEWPGARYYISKAHNDEIVDLNFVKNKPNLQYGDIVERHLQNDDFVVFNRQPSLHKMSIMGHRVKVLPGSTFRLNLAVTTPYNADFDGDEMNMHVPQNLETKAEVKHIMHVPEQIITPQSNRAVMGLNQDSLLGIRLFTLRDLFVTKQQLFDLLMQLDDWNGVLPKPAIIKPEMLWSGKQILSFIIPKINYLRVSEKGVKSFYRKDLSIIIKKGEILVGTMNKSIVGAKKGSLIGCIWIDYGPNKTKEFLSYSQKLIVNWMVGFGWTVGIEDTIIPVQLMKKIEEKRVESKMEFYKVLQDTQKEKKKLIVHQPGKTIMESFEHKVNTLLNNCRDQIGKMLNEHISIENHIKNMIISGSKGNNINISQISGLVGQQNVSGRRIPFGFQLRTLPHFMKNDLGPESRGFVANSYYKGLTPEEFFFHTMGGREGLIDTAVKTSQTGYIQRRLVKALEDVMVQYDGSVRDSNGNIIQYLYGEDGISAEYIEEQKFDLLKQSDDNMYRKCLFFNYDQNIKDLGFEDSVQRFYENKQITEYVKDSLLNNKQAHQILFDEFKDLMARRDKLRTIFGTEEEQGILPVNVDRLITHAQFHNKIMVVSDLNPVYVVEQLEEMMKNLQVVFIERQSLLQSFSKQIDDRALFMFRTFLKYKLCSKKVVLDYKLSKRAFNYLLKEIALCFQKSKINPGEMGGSIAAQSLGETLTQMTLNTFHFAGVSSQNITLGVPRIQEIINCSKNIKGASMMIFLEEHLSYDSAEVHKLISTLEFTTVGHLAITSEIYFDPKINETVVKDDEDLLLFEEERKDFSPWVLRIALDPVLLGRKGITLKEMIQRIEYFIPQDIQIIESLETVDPIIVRIRLLKKTANDFQDIKKIEQFILNDMSIKGFCKKVSYRRQPKKCFGSKGIEFKGDKKGEFVLETSGTDIMRVLRLPSVDKQRTTTNHIWDIFVNFGIEAARISIMREINVVFTFFNIYVNYRHISLLAETITAQGKLMSISRNGINRVYTSPFRKCSFEETVDILIKAAVYANIDYLKGVTENVMMGQLAHMGTGAFDIMMDTYYLLPKDSEKEKISELWTFFPDQNPVLEIEAVQDEEMDKIIMTPLVNMNTPAPLGNLMLNRTPVYNQVMVNSPNMHTPVMTPGKTPKQGILGTSHLMSPKHPIYSPFLKKSGNRSSMYQNMNRIQSPLLVSKGLLSPGYRQNGEVSQYGEQSGTELRYSPITPNYNASPARMMSPKSNKHIANMSPTYSYGQASPQYSPQGSTENMNMTGTSGGNNSPIGSDPDRMLRHVYNPESPSYQQHAQLVHRNEYSDDEEEGDENIKQEGIQENNQN